MLSIFIFIYIFAYIICIDIYSFVSYAYRDTFFGLVGQLVGADYGNEVICLSMFIFMYIYIRMYYLY